MKIKSMHPNFRMPTKGTNGAGAYDLYMTEKGYVSPDQSYGELVNLGFAAEVPPGHAAMILPRSGVGVRHGLALNNTVGVIDSDYRGEWMACLRSHNEELIEWEAQDKLLQMLIVPVAEVELVESAMLSDTKRGSGGFGSTGK